MPAAHRVVLDTNVVLSALVFSRGRLADLRVAWQSGRFVPLVDTRTAGELVRVLAYPKFRLSGAEREELLADFLPYAMVVPVPATPPAVPVCEDPFDLPFLELALTGHAKALVSGDQHLLRLGRVDTCAILTPQAFLVALAGAPKA